MRGRIRTGHSMRTAVVAAAGRVGSCSPRKAALAAVIALSGVAAPPAWGLTYYIDTAGDPGPGGTTSLRQAIALAATDSDGVAFDPSLSGSVITLGQGEIAVDHSITITGLGAGKLTIDAQYNSRIFNFTTAADGKTASVSGLTLTQGAAASLAYQYGGAIYAGNMALVLHDVVVTLSQSTGGGAVALVRAGPSSIVDSTIAGNFSEYCAGIRAFDTDLTLEHSVVSANSSFQSAGGGLCLFGGHTSIVHSRIAGNSGKFGGGGIYAFGAILNPVLDPHLDIDYSTIRGNYAENNGSGLFVNFFSYFGMRRSLVAANVITASSPSSVGGAINAGGVNEFYLYGVTIAGNSAASDRAGLVIDDAGTTGDFKFVTIAGNHSTSSTSRHGMGVYAFAGAPITLKATIVANNLNSADLDDLAGTFVLDHSLVKHPGAALISGSGLIGVDPQLGGLGDHGGPTLTMLPAATSPAVDATDVDLAAGTDQRGFLRVVGATADIGAVERQNPEDIIFRNGMDLP